MTSTTNVRDNSHSYTIRAEDSTQHVSTKCPEIEGNLVIDGARGETFVWKGLTKSVTRILKLQAI